MGGTCSGASLKRLPKKILIVGNTGAGKTHLLYSWLLGRNDLETVPTDSFNVERIVSGTSVYMMWDLCGCKDFRLKRRQFFHGTDGVVYVIDPSSDSIDAIDDLTLVSSDRDLHHLPCLVLISRRNGVKTDLLLQVKDALRSHGSVTSVMDVDVLDQKSVNDTLHQLDRMFVPTNGHQ